jgi:hypothetical protein
VLLAGLVAPLGADVWQLRFSSRLGGTPDRSVSAASCEELADAAALWIALSIDPGYAARRAEASAAPSSATFADAPEPEPAPSPPPLPSPPALAPPPARREPELAARYPLGVAVGVSAQVLVGRIPGLAPGAAVHGSLSVGRVELGLVASGFPTEHESLALRGGAVGGGDYWLGAARASVGYSLFDGALTPFLGFEVDRLAWMGTGVQPKPSGERVLLAGGAGLSARYTVKRPFRLFVQGFMSALLVERPVFRQLSQGAWHEVYRPAVAAGSLGLGAEIELD